MAKNEGEKMSRRIPATAREWLQFTIWISDGVDKGFIERDKAYQLVKELEDALNDETPIRADDASSTTDDGAPVKRVRLKKDGTPWGKKGSRKQPSLPGTDGDQ